MEAGASHQWLWGGVLVIGLTSSALSSDLVYSPVNPSFGGSPLNSGHLIGLANAQNEFKQQPKRTTVSTTDRFIQMLQSRLYSSLAQQVSEAIFGDNAQQQGKIKFQDQEVSFVNTGTEIRLAITDFTTGQVTEIIVPTLVTQQ
jgi:curli production assembly/transport component CsgF